MQPRAPVFRWTLTVAYSRNKHYLSRQTVSAPTQVEAERQAVNIIREMRLTDPHAVPWDRWTLMGRDANGRPLRIVAMGTHDGTTWSATSHPVRRFGRGG